MINYFQNPEAVSFDNDAGGRDNTGLETDSITENDLSRG